jgi:HEAT repeat protein
VARPVEETLAALKAASPFQRQRAAEELAEQPSPAACAALVAALDDTHPQVREAVINALRQQAPADSLRPLAGMLHGEFPGRRNAAHSVLIEMGARTPATLIQALDDPSPDVRQAAAEVLGSLRLAPAVAPLASCLYQAGEITAVREAAAQALGKIGDRAATPALIAAAADAAAEIRLTAIQALGQLDDERAVPPLLEMMQLDVASLPTIIEALGNLGQPEAVAPLASILATQPEDQLLGTAALEALVKIIIEPESEKPETNARLVTARRLVPIAPLLHALQAHSAPGNAYAAHLLGWLRPPEALPHLVTALGQLGDARVRDAATEAILRYGRAALGALKEALAHPAPAVRESAASLLGMVGDAGVVPELLEHLNEGELPVRQAVLHALGNLGGEAAYAGLLQAMEDPATQDTVLGIIGQTRDSGLLSNLQHYLYQGQPSACHGAARALSLLGDEAAVTILLNATRVPDETIRSAAAEALSLVRGNRAIDVLIEALDDRNWLVRQKAVEALGSIPDGRALAALAHVPHEDGEWRVRQTLVQALGRVRDARIYAPLRELAHDPDDWIRRDAMALCARLDDSPAVEILLAGLHDPETSVRRAALAALGYQRAKDAALAVAECLLDPGSTIRLTAVRTLAEIGAPLAIERIALLVDDDVEEVRLEVVEALGGLGQEESLGALEVLLRDKALRVRQRAAQALGRLNTPAAIETLVAALNQPLSRSPAQQQLRQMGPAGLRALLRAARSAQPELRAAAAATLGTLRALRPQIIPTLEFLLQDPDQRVRDAAKSALAVLQAEDPA